MDYAAATPIDPVVFEAMKPYFVDRFYNPSALYMSAKNVHKDIESARSDVAGHLGARPTEIFFTAGGTEANNLAIQGVMNKFPDDNLIVSAIEHDSVLESARKFDYREAQVHSDGRIDTAKLSDLIDDKTVLVSVMYANNEIGTIQPIKQTANLIKQVRRRRNNRGIKRPIYLHSDACQASQYLDLQVPRLGVDLMTINGGKIYGPKQSGALYIRSNVLLDPLILGGGQERAIRSGTENVAGIIGLSVALNLAQRGRKDEASRVKSLRDLFISEVSTVLPHAKINGSLSRRLPNNVHITIPGTDNERMIMALDEMGAQIASGSACSASKEEPSHVLKAIGLSESDVGSSLRITMGKATTESDVITVVDKIAELAV